MSTNMLPPRGDDVGEWTVRPASQIPIETVAWVWPGRIPAGKLTEFTTSDGF